MTIMHLPCVEEVLFIVTTIPQLVDLEKDTLKTRGRSILIHPQLVSFLHWTQKADHVVIHADQELNHMKELENKKLLKIFRRTLVKYVAEKLTGQDRQVQISKYGKEGVYPMGRTTEWGAGWGDSCGEGTYDYESSVNSFWEKDNIDGTGYGKSHGQGLINYEGTAK